MIYFLVFVFFAGGLFVISSEVLGLPPVATIKGVKTAVKSQQSLLDSLLAAVVMPIVKIVSPFIGFDIPLVVRLTGMSEKFWKAGS